MRLTYLLQSIDTRQTFDLGVLVQQSMDNPVFYVQMAHARMAGIARKAAEAGVERAAARRGRPRRCSCTSASSTCCAASAELPDVVALAVADRAPHQITTWVRELAGAVHGFYHDCYVRGRRASPPELTQARLWLVEAARIGLAIGLDLLGVSAPDRMRRRTG